VFTFIKTKNKNKNKIIQMRKRQGRVSLPLPLLSLKSQSNVEDSCKFTLNYYLNKYFLRLSLFLDDFKRISLYLFGVFRKKIINSLKYLF
jgi:hypothetical protein